MEKNNGLMNLGLAYKAKKLVIGSDKIYEAIKKKEISLIVLACDVNSDMTRQMKNKGAFYNIPILLDFSSSEISNAIGIKNVKALGISDKGFATLFVRDVKKED